MSVNDPNRISAPLHHCGLLFSFPAASSLTGQAKAVSAASLLALAVGAAAFGAVAIGALAVGRLVVGRLVIKNARFGALEVDELTVRKLRLVEHEGPIP
jgi:hypothetical protein